MRTKLPSANCRRKKLFPYGIGLSLIFIPFVLLSKIITWLTGIDFNLLDFILSFYNIPFILGLYFFQKITLQLGSSKYLHDYLLSHWYLFLEIYSNRFFKFLSPVLLWGNLYHSQKRQKYVAESIILLFLLSFNKINLFHIPSIPYGLFFMKT